MIRTDFPPNLPPKRKYRINEVCEMIGICRESLRKYTRSGLIRAEYNCVNGRPYYIGLQVNKLYNMLR